MNRRIAPIGTPISRMLVVVLQITYQCGNRSSADDLQKLGHATEYSFRTKASERNGTGALHAHLSSTGLKLKFSNCQG
jgi:hypothetical protein